MADFFQLVGIVTLACVALAAVAATLWLVTTVIETKQRLDHWRNEMMRENGLATDRYWQMHHRIKALENTDGKKV